FLSRKGMAATVSPEWVSRPVSKVEGLFLEVERCFRCGNANIIADRAAVSMGWALNFGEKRRGAGNANRPRGAARSPGWIISRPVPLPALSQSRVPGPPLGACQR